MQGIGFTEALYLIAMFGSAVWVFLMLLDMISIDILLF